MLTSGFGRAHRRPAAGFSSQPWLRWSPSFFFKKATFIWKHFKWYCTYFNAKFGEVCAYLATEMLVGI